MRKKITLLIMLCLFYTNGYSQTPFWSDSFEDTGSPSSGTRSAPSAFTTSVDRLFNRTDAAGVSIVGAAVGGTSYAYIGTDGTKFWAGEDTDNGLGVTTANVLKTVTWSINISGKSNIKLKGLFAAGNTVGNAYENGIASSSGVFDYMSMQYSIDGGQLQNLLSFYPLANLASGLFPDTDFDANGDPTATALSNTFTEFIGTIAGTGTTLTLYLNMSMTGSAEEVAVDNLRLVEMVSPAAPTDITLSPTAINENVPAGSTVGTLSSTDVNVGDTFTYTLVSGTGSTDNSSFSISGNSLTINASPNFEAKSSYAVRIRTSDGSLTFEKPFTININNVNEAPTDLSLSNTTISENVGAGTTVGTLSSTDPDAASTFTYLLVSGTGSTDNSSFSISGNSLTINTSPNFEAKSSYAVRIRTSDGSLTFEKPFTINISNVNEAPTNLSLSNTTISENVAAGTTVGTLSSTDPDAGSTFTYSLVSGTGSTDNSSFSISGNSLTINASPNFEAKSSYSVRIRTSDGGLTFEKEFTININNINEAPTNIALSNNSINENEAAGSTVGTLSSTDPDAGSTFTYSLVSGTGSTDNNSFSISGNSLTINASPDFETKSSYSVRISTSDGGLTFEKEFTITINDVCDLNNAATLSSGVITATQPGASYQWIQCPATTLIGENGQTFTPTANGSYSVVVTIGGCNVVSPCISVTTLATADFEEKSKFTIQPNPSQGIITIESDSAGDYQVINELGQILKTFKIEANATNTIDLENLNNGLYFIKGINGAKSKSYKLLINK